MRHIYILLLLMLASSALFAQVPQAFKYQAVARDLNGDPVINQEITVKISILAGSPEGTVIYREQHQITTNNMGLFTLEIGNPTQVLSGSFAEIDWGAFSHFLETAIDLTGSGQFHVLGVSQFLSVPYALYAGQTGDTSKWQKNQNVVYYNKGQVGIGTSQPDSSAKLDVNSNSQGFLPPRMTTEERDSIPNPAAGLIIFNTDTHCINFFNGSEWVEYGRDPMDTFECGQMFTDPRDKQQYQTVHIGEQCWFAENLNFGTKINASLNQTDNETIEKYCYENVPANCNEFGGLYQWDEMMAYDTMENTKGICPEGWHLPNQAEWQTLFDAFGGANAAGTELATTGTSGFDALMNGKYDAVAGFSGQNNLSTFWSSSGTPGAQATGYDFTSGSPVVNTSNGSVFNGFGVRCLKGLPNVTNPNLKVIDTTVYHLVSYSLEMAQGIYRYEIIGSRKAKDLITADNIIVGTENYGYLRKVDETVINGNEMTLTTSDATFEDAFIEGEFTFNTGLTGKGGHVMTFTRIKYLAPGVKISPQKDRFTYDFSGMVLYEGNNISLTIPQGHITLDPAFKFDFKFKNKRVERLAFYADNTIFENSIDVQLNVTGSASAEFEKTFAEVEKIGVFMVGWVPVVAVITTKLTANLGFNFDNKFSATTGYTNTNTLSFGVKYEYGDWQKIWDLKPATQLHPITWNDTIAFSQTLEMLVPEIDVMFYGVAGPYFNMPPWEKLEANLSLPELNYDASLDVGLKGNLGAAIKGFGEDEDLVNYSTEIFGFSNNLYHTPSKLEMISGNNQTGKPDSLLPEPLKVKVTDNLGLTWVPSRVHFKVETGGGSLSETDVWTNSDGFAETWWTLGNEDGEQTVKVEVQKANGNNISGSPLEFTATTSDGCQGLSNFMYGGKIYNTVEIGDQCWMKENLEIDVGNNWWSLIWGFDENYNWVFIDSVYEYGRFYDWNTALTASPTGWHLPSYAEWTILFDYLGGSSVAGGKMKEAGTNHWYPPNNGATNSSGFTGLPGGIITNYAYYNKMSLHQGFYGFWWSSSDNSASYASHCVLEFQYQDALLFFQFGDIYKSNGLSVRCLRD